MCTDPSPNVNGICVNEADHVTVKDLTVAGFPSTGIYAYEAADYTVARVRARDNNGYGIAGQGLGLLGLGRTPVHQPGVEHAQVDQQQHHVAAEHAPGRQQQGQAALPG